MTFLGFEQYAYRTNRPMTKDQKLELENRIKILEDIVPHDMLYHSMQNLVPQVQFGGDLPRVIYYNYLIVAADIQQNKKEKVDKDV